MYKVLVCDDEKRHCISNQHLFNQRWLRGNPGAKRAGGTRHGKKHNDVHVVLMDIMMPVMDGIEAMVEIRKISNVPVILLTAKSEDTDKVLGLTVGADDYVTKPFNPVELQAKGEVADQEIHASWRRQYKRRKACNRRH